MFLINSLPPRVAGKLEQAMSPAALFAALHLLLQIHPILSTTTTDLLIVAANSSAPHCHRQQRAAEIGGASPNNSSKSLEASVVRAERSRRVITVRKDGTGDFRTVTDAVDSIPIGNTRRTVVKIGPGVYREKIVVDRSKPYVTFCGEPHAMPTLSFHGTAAVYGTWNSATVAVESHHFVACNIIFENTAPQPGDGAKGAQAVAMRISGDKAAFYNCRFLGYQDTLCDDQGKHFFKDCYIRGTVDFIFGNGRSIYLNCEIESVAEGVTYITAQGRSKLSDNTGFSFLNCSITGTGSAYLGRAWRDMSRVVFANTYMGSLINPRGWDDKGILDRGRTVYFGEYKCMGPGAATDGRASYARVLSDEQAKPFLSKSFIRADTWLLPPPTQL